MSNGVSLIVYVNTARNKNTSECLGGLKYSYRCQKMWDNMVPVFCLQICACIRIFFLLVLILNSIPAIEGRKICKKKSIYVYKRVTY